MLIRHAVVAIAAVPAGVVFAALGLAQQKPIVSADPSPIGLKTKLPSGYSIPTVDISGERERQVVVDREPGQYLGHPTTVLLEDGRTILIVYPKGHGRGAIVYKRSTDVGK